jgi:hypothetical protein
MISMKNEEILSMSVTWIGGPVYSIAGARLPLPCWRRGRAVEMLAERTSLGL